jgi:lysophospholipase L1-like esterase
MGGLGRDIFVLNPGRERPFYYLRPDSSGRMFESTIVINRKGFRGAEIPDDKGDAYRIVALGESTTFGFTMHPQDRPWPEVLAELIRGQIRPRRPVQVINAGVPGHDLRVNLRRMAKEILTLQPDLILSYHGSNGFYLLDDALPRTSGPPPPAFKAHPLRLPADCEYRLRMLAYRRRHTAGRILRAPELAEPLKTEYAMAYRELIAICHTNGIRLAIGNFSMAVNSESDLDVAEFYRTAAPGIHLFVRANAAHTIVVEELAKEFPEVIYVDTHPNLDGHPGMSIDHVHMTQAGRQQIAENFFRGIRNILESDLGKPVTP